MKHLYIRLQAISPLSIRADHAPDGAETVKYIPGTTFVGSLAAIHRLLYPEPNDAFERFFLREQVLYPNLYPAVFDKNSEGLQDRNLPVYPLPKTALSCKRHPGFRFPVHKDNEGHGVRDSLIDWALFALGSNETYRGDTHPLAALRKQKNCCCGEAMDHFDGYYRRNDIIPEQMIGAQIEGYTRLRTHTGIHRESGTVQDKVLYNRQVFEEGMKFWGMIQTSDDTELISQLRSFLRKDIGTQGLLHIGTGRSRGMGKVALSVDLIEDMQDRFDLFKKRLDAFNDLFHEQAATYQLRELSNRYFFALTLHAPLILCDDLLRYRGTIDEETLTELLPCPVPELRREYQVASVRRITGWQELWGMPRVNEYAIEMGSVFLFSCASPLDTALYRALFELEENGIGKRRAEGFGRLAISDRFHRERVLR